MQGLRIAFLLLGLIAAPKPPARADDAFLRTGILFIGVSGTNGDLLVDGLASGSVHAIFDVVGWFE